MIRFAPLALLLAASCAPSGQSEWCKKSAQCEASLALKTGTLGTEAIHGPNGSCWKDPILAAGCDVDCKNGLEAAQKDSLTNKLPGCEPGGIPFDGGVLCAANNGGCAAEASCVETGSSVSCTCNTGFTGNGMTCADLDECLSNNGGCALNATCTNTPGSRTCDCNSGFVGDGGTCVMPAPLPVLTSLDRAGTTAGSAGFTLVLTGTGFVQGGSVVFGGVSIFAGVSMMGTSASANIPTSSLTAAGTRQVTFVNPAPGGGSSNALGFNVLTDAPTILASGMQYSPAIAIDTADVYFAASDAGVPYTVAKVSKAGGAVTNLAGGQRGVAELFVDAAAAYWYHTGDIQFAAGYVRRVALSGGAVTTMANEANGIKGMTVDATDAYFVDAAGNLKRVNVGSASPITIGSGYGSPQTALFFDHDATQLYFGQSYFSVTGLWRAQKSGGSAISYSPYTGRNVAVDATDVFFLAYVGFQPSTLMRMPKAGGTATPLFTGVLNPNDIAVDGSGVYFTDSNGIHHVPKAGGGITTLSKRTATSLALDSSAIYFAGLGPSVIGRIAKPGTAAIASLMPQSANVGSADVTITLTVSGPAIAGAVISANGTPLVTSGLTATIPASLLATAGTLAITLTNPGAGPSAPVVFSVNNLVPTLTAISPTSLNQYSGDAQLTLTGTKFVIGGKAFFGTNELATVVLSPTSATATILSTMLTTSGARAVTFVNPAPGGGASNAQTFTINAVAGNPLPIVTQNVAPAEVRTGSNGLYLTVSVDPASVLASTVVRVNAAALPTDTSQISSGILRAYFANVGATANLDINVFNPPPAGGATFAGMLDVVASGNPIPTPTGLTPSTVTAGAASTAVTIGGAGFVTGGSVVLRSFPNQVMLTPTTVTASQVTFTIPAAQLTTAGAFDVVFVNPAPGGGNSAALTFTVQ